MLRLAPAGAWILALAPLACATLACGAPQQPPPSKLAEAVSPIQDPPRPTSDDASPFRPPSKVPPLPRSEPQLAPDALAAALNSAAEARKIGDDVSASAALHTCANKIPQSVRCEGELAAILAHLPRFKYEADYYLDQVAAAADDPDLDATYYRRLGEALVVKGRFAEAGAAYQRMIDRSSSVTAADYNLLSVTLQGAPDRLVEAADALRRAHELDPSRIDWIRDQGILLGQTADRIPRAIELLEEYKTRATDPAQRTDTERRIVELREQLQKLTPTPADGAGSRKKRKTARPK